MSSYQDCWQDFGFENFSYDFILVKVRKCILQQNWTKKDVNLAKLGWYRLVTGIFHMFCSVFSGPGFGEFDKKYQSNALKALKCWCQQSWRRCRPFHNNSRPKITRCPKMCTVVDFCTIIGSSAQNNLATKKVQGGRGWNFLVRVKPFVIFSI